MNDIQENKYSTYLVVQEHLDDHAADYATHPKIPPAKTELDQLISDIEEADGLASENITGVAQDKAEERDDLEKICFKVAAALHSYADDQKDRSLQRKTKYSLSDFRKMRDGVLNIKASHLHKLAAPLLPLLADYRLTPAEHAQLETERAEYFAMIPETRDAIIDRQVAGEKVDLLMKKTDALLLKLDGYVDSYRFENPDLWQEYQLARAIVDNTGGGNGGEQYSESVNPGQQKKVADIEYNPATEITIEVNGAMLQFALFTSGIQQGGWINVNPGNEFSTTLGDMAPAGNEIYVFNPGAMPSDYTLTIG